MPRNLPESIKAIEHFASSSAKAPAVLIPNGPTLSFDDLWRQMRGIGKRLTDSGIGPQEIVAVLAPLGIVQVLGVLGTLTQCACAPLQPRTVPREVQDALSRCHASGLIVSPEFAAEARAALDLGLTVVFAVPDIRPEEWRVEKPDGGPRPFCGSAEAILFLMSSGTTGSSRVIPLSPANLNADTASRVNRLKLTSSDRQLLMTSLAHGLGVWNTLAQFQVGGSVIVTTGFDPRSFRSVLEYLHPTWYDCAPALHEAALAELKRFPPQLPLSLRFVQSAGGVLSPQTRTELQDLLKVPVFNDYGMTEAGTISTDAFMDRPLVERSAGIASGSDIAILGSYGEFLSADQEGEIIVHGPAVFSGYLDDPEADFAAFHQEWLRTGDAGHLDSNGNLFITGRMKEMINRGGEKISPGEVDAVIASHPAVLEAAAYAVPHPTLGENLACAVVLRSECAESVTAIELRQFAAQRLAPFKVPHRIRFVDTIPRGELGKPQRWLLAQNLKAQGAYPPAPREISVRRLSYDIDDIFYKLHEIWARILERNDLSFDEDFFEAGGDSLAAINMLTEVDQRFGSDTSATAASFFDEPTLERLTDLVGKPKLAPPQDNDSAEIKVFPVTAEDLGPSLFCVPADREEGLYFRRLATHLRGKISLSIVRPANTLHSRALFTFESAGKNMAIEVRKIQPEGPYLLGGFCYGGIVAIEAARELRRYGQDVRVILFDAPMPGWPPVLRSGRAWIDKARHQWKEFCIGDGRPDSRQPSLLEDLLWFKAMLGMLIRRCVWSAIVPGRFIFAKSEQFPIVTKILAWTQAGYLPLYASRSIDARILHFLCADEPRVEASLSRYGWRKVAVSGITEQVVLLDHPNVLHESNLPGIAQSIVAWTRAR